MSKPKKEFRPQAHATIYLIAIIYLGYLLFQLVRSALAGGSGAPTTVQLIAGILLLGGGMVFLGFLAWRMSRIQPKEEGDDPSLEDMDK
jgi:TRAP-type C4-dicarboxylate transport system permease small subunit